MLFVSLTDLIPCSISCGIELRLDQFPSIHFPSIARYIQNVPNPILLTWRGPIEIATLETLITMRPAFIDLELSSISADIAKRMDPTISWIVSYHNFEKTPDNLEEIYASMRKIPAATYKIATFCNSTLDALRLLSFAKARPKVSAICMGDKGSFGRVLGPIVGNLANYAAPHSDHKTAPGQYTVDELESIYHFSTLSVKTAIYGLIGSPVTQSIGHLHHNQVFRKNAIDAVYIKMDLSADEMPLALPFFKILDIKGLSVTMPLKEKILPFVEVDEIAHAICAVNTLRLTKDLIYGTNTDAKGAIEVLLTKTPLTGKTVVLLGAGGAARALIYALKREKAHVWIVNRTEEKGRALAKHFDCQFGPIPENYDVIINCISHEATWITPSLLPNKIAMDIHIAKETPFLKIARERGCELLYGEQMFYAQAALQTKFWIDSHAHTHTTT
jgi:3-dehydroquinate dehydratase/shikimate dehydrogenase